MLPKHGVVVAVFLLAHVARLTPRYDTQEWISSASQRSIQGHATDLKGPAETLLGTKLAQLRGYVVLAPTLRALSYTADRPTLLGIARLLLNKSPPVWLWLAVSGGAVLREYIPSADLDSLNWLEPELDELLIGVHNRLTARRDENRLKEIGNAAEALLLAALNYQGLTPLHVASFFDGYGYDIEVPGKTLDRIEVKSASPRTRGRFFISRNEYEKSRLYKKEWRLLQIVFTADAFSAKNIGASHIAEVIELSAEALWACIPEDPPGFTWTDSAEIIPDLLAWTPAEIVFDPSFSVVGLT